MPRKKKALNKFNYVWVWLHGCVICATEGSMFDLMLCCHHLEILNHFLTRGPAFSFYTKRCKLCSWSWKNLGISWREREKYNEREMREKKQEENEGSIAGINQFP